MFLGRRTPRGKAILQQLKRKKCILATIYLPIILIASRNS
jgi:hypothetical protein